MSDGQEKTDAQTELDGWVTEMQKAQVEYNNFVQENAKFAAELADKEAAEE